MRFAVYRQNGAEGLAAANGKGLFRGYPLTDSSCPGRLADLVAQGSERLLEAGSALLTGPAVDLDAVEMLPPLPSPPKILCVGLARKPPLWMKPGDVCDVELEGLGVLCNPIVDQASAPAKAAGRATA
jgi:2-keto-4-pentenoate hydratase/2-oxohepta-3-ene-1,7-dioic acid hydratase in catechol pathway